MITPAFDRAFSRLVRAFKRHQDVPRSSDQVSIIGDARWELHLARQAVAVERRDVIEIHERRMNAANKIDIQEEDLARLQVAAVSAGFS